MLLAWRHGDTLRFGEEFRSTMRNKMFMFPSIRGNFLLFVPNVFLNQSPFNRSCEVFFFLGRIIVPLAAISRRHDVRPGGKWSYVKVDETLELVSCFSKRLVHSALNPDVSPGAGESRPVLLFLS